MFFHFLGGGHYNESDPSTGGGGSGFLNFTAIEVFDGMNIRLSVFLTFDVNFTIMLGSVSVGGPKGVSFIRNADTNETVLEAMPGNQKY